MAGGMDLGTGGKGGKKPLDVAINLVPFIDLMAVTIAFLIMTAVWTQIGRLQVAQQGSNADPQDQKEQTLQPVTLLVTEKTMKLTVGSSVLGEFPMDHDANGRLKTEALVLKLKDASTQQPEQKAITVQVEDNVKYDDLVRIVDDAVGDNESLFPGVSVAPAMG